MHELQLGPSDKAALIDEPGKTPHSVATAREAKHIDFVARVVVDGEEGVELLDVHVDALAQPAALDPVERAGGADAAVVEEDLLDVVSGRLVQHCHLPK